MAKIKLCKEESCHNAATTAGYCRLHYLKNWKELKGKKDKASADRLNRYIEYIVKKHPDNYMDVIKKDIRSENFENRYGSQFDDADEIEQLFDSPDFEEDIKALIKDLKINTDF